MMKFETTDAARAFFNNMHTEYDGLVVEAWFYMKIFDVEIEELGKPTKVVVGTGGDFFIIAEGVFIDECAVSDSRNPLPERIQKLIAGLVSKGYTPFGMLEAVHEHRCDTDVPEDFEESFRQTIRQHETMLALLK